MSSCRWSCDFKFHLPDCKTEQQLRTSIHPYNYSTSFHTTPDVRIDVPRCHQTWARTAQLLAECVREDGGKHSSVRAILEKLGVYGKVTALSVDIFTSGASMRAYELLIGA